MSVTMGSQMPPKITKPYVYRGTGEDQFPETAPPPEPPKPKAPTAEEYRTRERERAREVARMKRAAAKRRQRYRPVLDIQNTSTWGNWRKPPFKPEPEPVFLDDLDIEQESPPEPPPPEVPRKPAHPAPGWKPMTGADLDSLLDEDD